MNINFLEREIKKQKLEIAQITYCYLIAIGNQNPILWKQFKNIINSVDEKINEAEK